MVNQKLKAALQRAADNAAKRLADLAVAEAKRLAPVVTGKLRESIHAEPMEDGSWSVVADAPEAWFVEYGTMHMAPEPFMRPAMAKAAAMKTQIVREEISKATGGL